MQKLSVLRLVSALLLVLGSVIALVGPVLIILSFAGEIPGQPGYVAFIFGLLTCFNGLVIAAGGHVMRMSCWAREQQWLAKSSPLLPTLLDTQLKSEPKASS